MSLFEPPNFDVFEECLRGVVARRTNLKFADVDVERSETDRAILLLVKIGVLNIKRQSLGIAVEHGDYWVAAHSQAKLVRQRSKHKIEFNWRHTAAATAA
jgi:hypothetical protein